MELLTDARDDHYTRPTTTAQQSTPSV
jgi:hypothetical protein